MFTLNGLPILADEIDILVELKNQLALNGIYRFNEFKTITNHIQFNCPMHKGGQEKSPSCGITTAQIRYADGKVVPPGTVHCFTCGYTASLNVMISQLFGKNDLGRFGNEWLAKNFVAMEVENRPEIHLNLSRTKHGITADSSDSENNFSYVTEDELDTYRYTHPYMYIRKLNDDVISLFDIGYDPKFTITSSKGAKTSYRCITFPIRDENGNTLFIARRSVDTKFFHYPKNVVKPVYGLYELKSYYGNDFPKELIVCESMFNCLTCWVYGKPAVALNGTGTVYQYKQLEKLPIRKLVLGLDPDEAGDRGRLKIHKYFNNKRLVTDLVIPKGKDINDLTKSEFDNLNETLTYFC